jgi:plasmid maintenance system killer protein
VGKYAAQTTVTSDRSRAEIERTLARWGATSFMYGWDAERSLLGFVVSGRQVRFVLAMPNRKDFRFTPARRYERSAAQVDEAYEQAVRQRWRALALVIKAKLEAVESRHRDASTQEFAMFFVLPDGQTVGDWVLPQVDTAYETGSMPPMLPQLEARKAIEV